MTEKPLYFPNLNGLRFIAALMVIVYHLERLKANMGLDGLWGKAAFVSLFGKLGVVLFFVLSGFLITYLLLAEEKRFAKIDLTSFYLRRVLRIWPLYFFIIFLGFFVLPFLNFFSVPGKGVEFIYSDLALKLALFTLVFPNLALATFGAIPF
ncbi:MAG: acyltransferase, partial [Xanthomonadales bacterium]|nr:acyltransferase [Xanthomonadales bacterium]